MTAPNPAHTLATILTVLARGGPQDHSEASDGPGEPVDCEADLKWLADRDCSRDERAREAS